MDKIKVLYIVSDSNDIAGATSSLLNLIHSVSAIVEPIALVQAEGMASEFLRSNGIRTIISPYRRNFFNYPVWLRPFLLLPRLLKDKLSNHIAVKRISKLLKQEDIKIVHSNSAIVELGIGLSKALGAKHVWHIREFMDLDFNFHPLGGMRRLRQKINQADAVIAISSPIAKHWGIDHNPNGYVIWDAVRPKNEISYIQQKEKYILFLSANMTKGKGADTALRAFALSRLADKGYQLYMIGGYSEENKKMLDETYTKNVRYFGFLKTSIKEFMLHASAFLMCSRHEGLGRTTVEAMFYGCPVIARRAGGTTDFVQDGINGFLFDTDEECAQLMKKVVSENMSELCRRENHFVAENFTEETYGAKIISVYYKFLNQDASDKK